MDDMKDTVYNLDTMLESDCQEILFQINNILTETETAKDRVRYIKTLLDNIEMSPEETFDFPFLEEKLKEAMEFFENVEYHHLGLDHISGGFTLMEYDYCDDDDIFFTFKWGVQSDAENSVHTERYSIAIEDFEKAESKEEIYKMLRESN
jgi:hypothetical protein